MKEKNVQIKKERIDEELEMLFAKRISSLNKKIIVVGTGITSSHLGDERNIREFLIADSVVNKLRDKNYNVMFYLFDDSYDPLNFRQLRVAVNKDEMLIKKFEKYCGMPLKLIPDPYECHPNYSVHFQQEILNRFHTLGIYPNIIDAYSSYESGLYDYAKEIVFNRYNDVKNYLKKNFPGYTMKKIFYPVCTQCNMMDGVEIKRVAQGRITVACPHCGNRFTDSWKDLKGKFSWKIDAAIKWNVFRVDFEPYSKAYLDPNVGSYFIAKKLSEEFFGGYYPESVSYGQIIMGKDFSFKILSSLPKEAFLSFFIQNRRKDMELSDSKFLQFAYDYKIDDNLSFYDYIVAQLPYDIFNRMQGKVSRSEKYIDYAVSFAKNFLGRDIYPKLPTEEELMDVPETILTKIKKLFLWVIHYKTEYPNTPIQVFSQDFNVYIQENNINRKIIFPIIRKLLSQEHTLPIYKIFYYGPHTYLSGCLLLITQVKSKMIGGKNIKYNESKMKSL